MKSNSTDKCGSLSSDRPGPQKTGLDFPPRENKPSRLMLAAGSLCVFASAFFFYFSAVVIRWASCAMEISPSFFVFARFLLGFFVLCVVMTANRRGPRPVRLHLLVGRTVTNALAVYCFYKCVAQTSVVEGNILNMTYPAFVAVLSWIILKKQRDPVVLLMVGAALVGVWLILAPEELGFTTDSLWGLGSGVFAAISIIYLNLSRQYHDSETVLFYMFGLGTIFLYVLFFRQIHVPGPKEAEFLFLCAGSGIAGQYLLTIGFRYVTAVEGSVISSFRILIAALLGPVIAADPSLGFVGWAGALMIFFANTVLALRHRGLKDATSDKTDQYQHQ